MKRAVITGAGGFIGRNLTEYLLAKGVAVYAVEVEAARGRILESPGVTPLCVDIGDRERLSAMLRDAKPDVVYHLAWAGVSTDVKNEVGLQLSNIPLAMTVLEACGEAVHDMVRPAAGPQSELAAHRQHLRSRPKRQQYPDVYHQGAAAWGADRVLQAGADVGLHLH